jgi:hypothetical protein
MNQSRPTETAQIGAVLLRHCVPPGATEPRNFSTRENSKQKVYLKTFTYKVYIVFIFLFT